MMETTYDPEADAYYARFVPDAMPIAQTIEVAPGVMIDLDHTGEVVGIEVLNVMRRAGGVCGASTKAAMPVAVSP